MKSLACLLPAWAGAMVAIVAGAAGLAEAARRPNIVLIMTDNQGAWTLGCYGNRDIHTPNIDRLAAQGLRMTHAMANNAVCSPTRATVLTGLMPSQHGVHCYLGAGGAQIGPGAYCTIGEFRTLPKILRDAGYVCGLSGKWHLGGNLRPQEGFSYWVTKPHGHSRGFYNQRVIEDGKIHTEPEYLTDFWTDHGVDFIEQNKDRPFFLFLAYNGPYGLGSAMREPVGNRHKDDYSGSPMRSFPRAAPHPWCYNYPRWIGDLQVIRKYAAEISGIDDGVGRILATLEKHGLERDTLVIFTADQGLAGGQSGFWGMGDHTRPLTAYDWTMSIPLIFRQPGRIPAAAHSDLLVSNYDLLPTLLRYVGLADRLPAKPKRPGRDFSAVLRGASVDWDNTVFYEFENVRAVRTDRWKYIERIHQQPNELYDLKTDPGERHNLFGLPASDTVQARLHNRLAAFFRRYADPKWDLWHGGRSKTHLITAKLFGIKNQPEGKETPGPVALAAARGPADDATAEPDGLIASPEPGWPQWRGSRRDGISDEHGLQGRWPEEGPKLLWKIGGLGTGWSAPIVVDGRVFITGDVGEDLVVFGLNDRGTVQWRADNGRSWQGSFAGARACCAFSAGRLYHLNAHGRLACLDAASGKELWASNILERFAAKNIAWAVSECVLVDGPRVLVTPGGKKALMAALDKQNGRTAWTTGPLGNDQTSYASPILFRCGGRRIIANCSSAHGFGVDADTGRLLWTVPLKNRYGANVTTPVYGTGSVFFVTPYGEQGRRYRLRGDPRGVRAEHLWTAPIDTVTGGAVLVGNTLFAAGYRRSKWWFGIDWQTGRTRCQLRDLTTGAAIYADGRLYCLDERGTVALLRPKNNALDVVGRFRLVPQRVHDAWTHPVLCNGRLYLRYHETLWCYDVKEKG